MFCKGQQFISFCIFSPRQQRHINQHVFGKDAVARGGVVDQHVGDRSHNLVVLNDGGAAQECGQYRTTIF